MKYIAGIFLIATLSACGGGNRDYDSRQKVSYHRSLGPISSACMASDRKARSPGLCGCIQRAADVKLSKSDQRRAVSFYDDPHQAQVVRQSSRTADETFWRSYREYVTYAEATCG